MDCKTHMWFSIGLHRSKSIEDALVMKERRFPPTSMIVHYMNCTLGLLWMRSVKEQPP